MFSFMDGRIQLRLIEDEMKQSYLDYAMSVIVGRALPDVRDGLKPVHRRILYSMHELGLSFNKPFKKCARIVGECFVKDTLVLTNKGLVPIQQIKRGDKVYTQSGLEEVSELFVMPKQDLLKVSLENGIDNIATKSQKFKVLTSDWKFIWKDAKNLVEGDYIFVKSTYPLIKKEVSLKGRKLNCNLAYALGLLMSDGWVSNDFRGKPRLGFCSSSVSIMNRIVRIFSEEFGYTPTIEERTYDLKTVNGQLLKNKMYKIRINRNVINQQVVSLFNLEGIWAGTKFIPEQIFRSPKPVVFSFISGLMDGDGCVHNHRNNITYATISNKLVKQLALLLQCFGIQGKVYVHEPKENEFILGKKVKHRHTAYAIEFNGRPAQELAKNLDLADERKKFRINELKNRKMGKSFYEILPFGSKILFSELSKFHLGGGWYKDTKGIKFRSGIKYPTGAKIRYSKELCDSSLRFSQIVEWGIEEKLKRIGSELLSFLAKTVKDQIYFVKVENVTSVKGEVTYDIQVKNRHEFIANGMVVHNCLGKYHPHGDVAVYESLVRMAQDFSLRYPLVNGQGNFGSVDNDPPAAQRYTEARLHKFAEELLADLEKETVNMGDNFDSTLKEPLVLPSKLPNLLLNGSSGIAVGMATNMMPHNIQEVIDACVAFIDNQDISIEELMSFIFGPDFPTGGILLGRKGILNTYKTGRGKVVVRGVADVEELKGRERIIITELPYQVNKALFIENMADLVKDKRLEGISDLRDESDREGMRVVIELKSGASSSLVLNQLYKHTALQSSFGVINLALVEGQPRVLGLRELILYFIEHRKDVVTRRTRYELRRAEERAHILEGLKIALENIDAVIALIKGSKDVTIARAALMNTYSLSELQAQAILDMKLQKLTSLETEKINQEYNELMQLILELKDLLSDIFKIYAVIKKELLELKGKYGDARRTKIIDNDDSLDIEDEDLIAKEDVVITITSSGYVKRLSLDTYKQQARGGKGVIGTGMKEEDYVEKLMVCQSHDYLLFFTNLGRVHWMKAYGVPEGSRYSKGGNIVNLLMLSHDERISAIIPLKGFSNGSLLMITKKGLLKKTKLEEYSRPRKGGIVALKLKEGDRLMDVKVVSGNDEMIIGTKKGIAVRFNEGQIRDMGRNASGVRGVRLVSDEVVGMEYSLGTLLTVTENGYGKRSLVEDYRLVNRGAKGVINIQCSERNGKVIGIKQVMDEDEVLFITKQGMITRVGVKDISVIGRNAQGVRLMRLHEGDKIIGVAKIQKEEKQDS